jgi:hypothetical protein
MSELPLVIHKRIKKPDGRNVPVSSTTLCYTKTAKKTLAPFMTSSTPHPTGFVGAIPPSCRRYFSNEVAMARESFISIPHPTSGWFGLLLNLE